MGLERPAGPDWWKASDGLWYPPDQHPEMSRSATGAGKGEPWTPDEPIGDDGPRDRRAWYAAAAAAVLLVIATVLMSVGGGGDLATGVSSSGETDDLVPASPTTSASPVATSTPTTLTSPASAAPSTTVLVPTSAPPTTAPPLPLVTIGNASFGDGITVVAEGLAPGVWMRRVTDGACSWRRLSGATGAPAETIVGVSSIPGRELLEIVDGDVAVESIGCGGWVPFEPAAAGTELSDGAWVVGWEMEPGAYQAPTPTASCVYACVSAFGGSPAETIQFGSSSGDPVRIDIAPTDIGFKTYGCGAWQPGP